MRLIVPSYLRPPDTSRVSPVMYLESGDARYTAVGAISSGCPMRPSGGSRVADFTDTFGANPKRIRQTLSAKSTKGSPEKIFEPLSFHGCGGPQPPKSTRLPFGVDVV